MNGDGRIDLVTGNQNNHSLSVLLNTTASGASVTSFATQALEAEPGPLGLNNADFNGDGRQDLVYTRQSGKVLVSLNTTGAPTGDAPSFAAQQAFATGSAQAAVATADLNGDGRPDLLIANHEDDTASVLLNTTAPGASTPSFAAQQAFATGSAPAAVATADLNGDGRPDLLIANHEDDTASVLLNTTAPGASTPSFAAQQAFATGSAQAAVATADLNGDGRPDLLIANHEDDTASVLLNTTAPGASTPSFAAQQAFATGSAPAAVATADLNGDGRPDLLIANHEDDTASVLLNTTAPGASTPSFAAQQAFATGSAQAAVATADLNGDGRPDLLIANHEDDTASVLLNTTAPGASTPSFAAQQAFATGGAQAAVATADLNGDGRPDLLIANHEDDTASVLLNTTAPGASTPSFAAQQAFATGSAQAAIATADLNGDGAPDAITADGSTDEISALLDTQYAVTVSPSSVTGTIHYAIPQVTLSSGQLAFGGQVLGSSAIKTVTVSNAGGANLVIESIAIGGSNAAEFAQDRRLPTDARTGLELLDRRHFRAERPGISKRRTDRDQQCSEQPGHNGPFGRRHCCHVSAFPASHAEGRGRATAGRRPAADRQCAGEICPFRPANRRSREDRLWCRGSGQRHRPDTRPRPLGQRLPAGANRRWQLACAASAHRVRRPGLTDLPKCSLRW